VEKINISIKDKIYTVEVASTKEEKEVGLQNRDSLKPNEGMLFIFESEQPVSF